MTFAAIVSAITAIAKAVPIVASYIDKFIYFVHIYLYLGLTQEVVSLEAKHQTIKMYTNI